MPREHEDWVRQLYLTHAPDLYRAARYRLQDPELAYDLTQEVFLTLLDKQAQVKHHPNPAGWLWKTLQYKLGHAFSRQAVRAKYEAGEADPDWLPAPLPATGGTLDEILPRQPAGTGPPTAENGLRGGPDLRGNQPASGHSPGHLRHLALPGQAAVQTLLNPFGRREPC